MFFRKCIRCGSAGKLQRYRAWSRIVCTNKECSNGTSFEKDWHKVLKQWGTWARINKEEVLALFEV